MTDTAHHAPNERLPIPVACDPTAIEPEERRAHDALAERLFLQRVREREDLAAGYAFRFDPEDLADLGRWVERERLCCPFFDFTIRVPSGGGSVWLSLTGSDAVKAFLDARIGESETCGR